MICKDNESIPTGGEEENAQRMDGGCSGAETSGRKKTKKVYLYLATGQPHRRNSQTNTSPLTTPPPPRRLKSQSTVRPNPGPRSANPQGTSPSPDSKMPAPERPLLPPLRLFQDLIATGNASRERCDCDPPRSGVWRPTLGLARQASGTALGRKGGERVAGVGCHPHHTDTAPLEPAWASSLSESSTELVATH